MTSSGTFTPSLTAGAARPGVCGTSRQQARVLIHAITAFGPSLDANRMWVESWDAKPAYLVDHTTRPTRPLGGAP